MDKKIKLAFVLLILFSIMSCNTVNKHFYYYETVDETSISGTVALVSIQLDGKSYRWSTRMGRRTTRYTFNFDNANTFANMIFDYIPIKDYGIFLPENLYNRDVHLYDYMDDVSSISNSSYDWGIPIVDEKNNPTMMNQSILKCLNENIEADYYMVINGGIIDFQAPRLFGLIPFQIFYEITTAVYDKSGEKIFSRNYRYQVKRASGRVTDVETFYSNLEKALEKRRLDIITDIEQLNIFSTENDIELKEIAI